MMKGTGLQRGRFLAVTIVALGLLFGSGAAFAGVEMLDDFEAYTDTDELRATWDFVGEASANLHLECDIGGCLADPWCAGHSSEGPANEGCKYMRISYLGTNTVMARFIMGGVDWSGLKNVRFYYRGRTDFHDGVSTLKLILTGNSGSTSIEGPLVPQVQCAFFGEAYSCGGDYCCPWVEYVADVEDWIGLASVELVDIVITPMGGNGRVYIDAVDKFMPGATPVEAVSWGKIKALYQ
jgi:hypothetical protein